MEDVQSRLEDALVKRDKIQTLVRQCEQELVQLLGKSPKRPRETIESLQEKIAKLERERTINSLPLKDEREILRQIHKCERRKAYVIEFRDFDHKIKQRKAKVTQYRQAFKAISNYISGLRIELGIHKTAQQLGCEPTDLVGMKMGCPPEKLGQVIGKKGARVKEISEQTNVTVNVDRATGDVRVIGPAVSLDDAEAAFGKVISRKEQLLDASVELVTYLTSKGINAIAEISESHPDVYWKVKRGETEILVRGSPEDITSLVNDLMSLSLAKKTIELESEDAGIVVGKKGATIQGLVATHQVMIDLERAESGPSTASFCGPIENINSAIFDIEGLLEEEREQSEVFYLESSVKKCLMLAKGEQFTDLMRRVNEATKPLAQRGPKFSLSENRMTLQAKSRVLKEAAPIVEATIRDVEKNIVKLNVDTAAVPHVIGKGGKNLKDILKSHPKVVIDFDRSSNEAVVCAVDATDVEAASSALRELIDSNSIKRINLGEENFVQLFGRLSRKFEEEGLKEAIEMRGERDAGKAVLIGKSENLEKALSVVDAFYEDNYQETVELPMDDLEALAAGGRKCMLAQISTKHKVGLSFDRSNGVIHGRGNRVRLQEAVQELSVFVRGDAANSVVKLSLMDYQVGAVVGRGGKTREDLEQKFEGVSITVLSKSSMVTIRGPNDAVESCRLEVLRLASLSRFSETLEVTQKQHDKLRKGRMIAKVIRAAHVQVAEQPTSVVVKGPRDDVRYAVSLLKEAIYGKYEAALSLPDNAFEIVEKSCKDATHLQRVQEEHGATISLDSQEKCIMFNGKRSQVFDAKRHVIRLLSFLLSERFVSLDLQPRVMQEVTKPAVLSDVALNSGTILKIVRDVKQILIFGSDGTRVRKALELLKPRIEEAGHLTFSIQLEASEDWLVSSLIGKGGKTIMSLRKETQCDIDVDSKRRAVNVSGKTVELVSEARKKLEEVIQEVREGNIFCTIPDEDYPAFIGRGGSRIAEREKEYGIDINVLRKDRRIQLSGAPDKIQAAKQALDEWTKERTRLRAERTAATTLHIRRNQVPSLLGEKGSNVRRLQEEHKCRIDVDKKTGVVSISCASEEKRAVALKAIEAYLEEAAAEHAARRQAGEESDGEASQESVPIIRVISEEEVDNSVRESTVAHDDPVEVVEQTNGSHTPDVTSAAAGSDWAAAVLKTKAESPPERRKAPTRGRSFESTVSADDWDATSVGGDLDEEDSLLHGTIQDQGLLNALKLVASSTK